MKNWNLPVNENIVTLYNLIINKLNSIYKIENNKYYYLLAYYNSGKNVFLI